jgi:hypothetical protein
MMLNILYIEPKEKDRWISGDRFIRPIIRRIIRGKTPIGGIEKVFLSLTESLHRSKIPFRVNPTARERKSSDVNILLGRGIESIRALKPNEPFIAGIGFSSHPLEMPDIRDKFNIKAYLSHCEWINTLYAEHWGDICTTWPVGIDTNTWKPTLEAKPVDLLIYNKIRWNIEEKEKELLHPILERLNKENISYKYIRYGKYKERVYKEALDTCKAMIFLCEHETQGIACNEAMSSGLPVFAWDEHVIRDPYYISLKSDHIPCTSVPFFNNQCGDTFKNIDEFNKKFKAFYDKVLSNHYTPAEYVNSNLSMEQSVSRLQEIIDIYWEK